MKYDVFISYKSESVNIVMAMAHALESDGIRCWYAPRNLDTNSAGKDFDDEIVEAIHNSAAMVVVLSEEALKSKWVKREVSQAEKSNIFVIPYVISELFTENGLRMRLEEKHWIDAFPNPEQRFNLLINNVNLLLGRNVDKDSGDEDISSREPNHIRTAKNSKTDFDYEEGMALYETKAYTECVEPLLRSAKNNNPKAKKQLCKLFFKYPHQLESLSDVVWDEIEECADDGAAYALFAMHCRYYEMGSQHDIAYKYLRRVLEIEEMPLALLRLGICHNWGIGTPQSHAIGLRYYRRALELGCVEAHSFLGQEYAYGNDVLKADREKAIELYEAGLNQGDERSGSRMVYLFLVPETVEKARKTAQRMIDEGMYVGYALMGDTYSLPYGIEECPTNDKQKAEQCYLKALEYDIQTAYSSLASLYWEQNRHDDAYKMAHQGAARKDGLSYNCLGFFYENDENYGKAWKYYMLRAERNGIGAVNLGRLIIDCKYQPEEGSINKLERLLDVEAHNTIEGAAEMLLRMMAYTQFQCDWTDYDYLIQIPKALPIIKLYAETGDSDGMYLYGRLLSEGVGKYYNPTEGRDWLRKAADAGDERALDYLMWDENNIADYGEAYLSYYVKDKQTGALPKIYKVLNHLLNLERNEGKVLDQKLLSYCFDIVETNFWDGGSGSLRLLKDNLQRIFPDYDPKAVEQGKGSEKDLHLYYVQHTDFTDDWIEFSESFLNDLYRPILEDRSTKELLKNENKRWRPDQLAIEPLYRKFLEYLTSRNIPLADNPPTIEGKDFVPFLLDGKKAQDMCKYILRCILKTGKVHWEGKANDLVTIDGEVDLSYKYSDLMLHFGTLMEYISKVLLLYLDKKHESIADELNKYLFWLRKEGIGTDLVNFTAEDVPKRNDEDEE